MNYEVRREIFEGKNEMRDQRLEVLKSQGMDAYIEQIKEQLKIPKQVEKRILIKIFS